MQGARPSERLTNVPGHFQDAYLHIPMHPDSQHLIRFASNGNLYQFQSLPFGLCTAPWIFTTVIQAVVAQLHIRGIHCVPYLDDWLFRHQDAEQLSRALEYSLALLRSLGFLINVGKSTLNPTQRLEYCGMEIDTRAGWFRPVEKRRDKIINLASSLSLNSATNIRSKTEN